MEWSNAHNRIDCQCWYRRIIFGLVLAQTRRNGRALLKSTDHKSCVSVLRRTSHILDRKNDIRVSKDCVVSW